MKNCVKMIASLAVVTVLALMIGCKPAADDDLNKPGFPPVPGYEPSAPETPDVTVPAQGYITLKNISGNTFDVGLMDISKDSRNYDDGKLVGSYKTLAPNQEVKFDFRLSDYNSNVAIVTAVKTDKGTLYTWNAYEKLEFFELDTKVEISYTTKPEWTEYTRTEISGERYAVTSDSAKTLPVKNSSASDLYVEYVAANANFTTVTPLSKRVKVAAGETVEIKYVDSAIDSTAVANIPSLIFSPTTNRSVVSLQKWNLDEYPASIEILADLSAKLELPTRIIDYYGAGSVYFDIEDDWDSIKLDFVFDEGDIAYIQNTMSFMYESDQKPYSYGDYYSKKIEFEPNKTSYTLAVKKSNLMKEYPSNYSSKTFEEAGTSAFKLKINSTLSQKVKVKALVTKADGSTVFVYPKSEKFANIEEEVL